MKRLLALTSFLIALVLSMPLATAQSEPCVGENDLIGTWELLRPESSFFLSEKRMAKPKLEPSDKPPSLTQEGPEPIATSTAAETLESLKAGTTTLSALLPPKQLAARSMVLSQDGSLKIASSLGDDSEEQISTSVTGSWKLQCRELQLKLDKLGKIDIRGTKSTAKDKAEKQARIEKMAKNTEFKELKNVTLAFLQDDFALAESRDGFIVMRRSDP